MTTDPARAICRERCAEFGDPPCFEVHADIVGRDPDAVEWTPCRQCLGDLGIEVADPLDPNAVVRPLL